MVVHKENLEPKGRGDDMTENNRTPKLFMIIGPGLLVAATGVGGGSSLRAKRYSRDVCETSAVPFKFSFSRISSHGVSS